MQGQGQVEFQKAVTGHQEQAEQFRKRLDTLSHIRLGVFIVGASLTSWLYWQGENLLATLLLAGFLVTFISFVVTHSRVKSELMRTRCRVQINQQYVDRISGSWTHFKDCGMDFVNLEHPFSSDLDIFGRDSLFQWMNNGNTYYGRTILAEYLGKPTKDIQTIYKRQAAIEELAIKAEFTQELQTEGMLSERMSQHPEGFITAIEKKTNINRIKQFQPVFYLLPAITLVSLAVLFGTGFSISPFIPLTLISLQLILTAIGFLRATSTLNEVYDFKENIEAYRNVIARVENESFTDPYLLELKSKMYAKGKPVSQQLKSLETIGAAIDLRHSALLNFLLNALLLWDYHCILVLENWKNKHAQGVRTWLETIGTLEALASLSGIRKINPDWVFPEVLTTDVMVEGQGIGHPLIGKEPRVCNDMSVKNSLGIITGSNMSGKTTMLRTIGINLVLAYAGAPVCASRMKCTIVDIFTSMRITDDLNSGISSFYAELLRIKKIIEHSHTKQPMLFLIDEIFRGTNSRDRILGAKSVLKNVSNSWVIGLVSTHDVELCDLEKDPNIRIKNYHFTEHYIDNKIKFDYKLREGRSQTTNARYLMKMVGIQLDDMLANENQ